MQRFKQLALAAAVVMLAASPVLAQGPRGFRGPTPMMLLGQKSVQEELKLSADQVQKVEAAVAKQMESFQGFRDLSEEDRTKKIQEMAKENEKFIGDNLKPDQSKRLHQIALQQQGGRAFTDEKVAKELALTDDQKGKIKDILEDTGNQVRELFQGGFNEEARTKMRELNNAATEKVVGLLTADQKTKYKEMTGVPFKGEIRFGPPGGGRGGEKKDK
jgi:Spy/CpxP family protein refolding chaperone